MTNPDGILRTPLYDRHKAMEARMGDVAGWEMPLSYRGALDEVGQVHGRASVFDLSHVGRIRVRGDGALTLLERLCTSDVAHQEDDTAAATLMLNDRGGIMDNPWLLRLEDQWLILCSPMNRLKLLEHLQAYAQDMGAKVDDQTGKIAMLSVAGPGAAKLLDPVLPQRVSDLPAGAVRVGSFMIARYIAARIDFAGPWGLHVILPNMLVGQAWRFITEKAGASVIPPAGLAALDVLRVESGLPAYGHEINETIDPFTAGLSAAVAMNHDFIGAAALAKLAQRTPGAERVGLLVDSPQSGVFEAAVPRLGDAVLRPDGSEIGSVTSGAFSPTLDKIIALAYVAGDVAESQELLLVRDDDRRPARVTALPFVGK